MDVKTWIHVHVVTKYLSLLICFFLYHPKFCNGGRVMTFFPKNKN